MSDHSNAIIIGQVGDWKFKFGEVELSLQVCITDMGPSFSISMLKLEKKDSYLPFQSVSASMSFEDLQKLVDGFASASAAMQTAETESVANDG